VWTILEGRRDAASATAIRARSENAPEPEADIEARLRANIVGELKPLTRPVELQPYDSNWPAQYTRIENLVRRALGRKALLIEHVGSTSVPNLSAKPVIDVVLAVQNSADEEGYIPALEGAGFVLRVREPDWFQHRMMNTPLFDGNLHVFTQGCDEIIRMVRFRDWLRHNPQDRDLYQRTKQDLAARNWTYLQEYAEAKSPVIRAILARSAVFGES
jgi:GrpB-like predicted nucleotidyltransferase (UPF0157 family)